jgi:hypothetical protein
MASLLLAWCNVYVAELFSMSDDTPNEPIELPALSAERRGPSAAVCVSGHVFAWFIDAALAPKHCAKCGGLILVACPSCKATLPGDGEMLAWVPYHAYCWQCGSTYPWRASDIVRAKRTLSEQAEVEGWSDAVKARADELVDDIAANRVAASEVNAALAWLGEHGAEHAAPTILDAIDRLADMQLKQALRSQFPGAF